MNARSSRRAACLACCAFALFSAVLPEARAQPTSAGEPAGKKLEFPSTWVNTDPISLDSLLGKGVFLYFFEEGCPRCRDRWPMLLETAAKFADEPVVFIAVNSGTSKSDVEQYARAVELSWPVIVDADRSLERACDIGEISLQNVMQAAIINPAGELRPGDWSNIEATIRRALEGAKWNVDPEDIPDELRPVWRNLEFARFADARPALAKALTARKSEIKDAARKLADSVDARIEKELAQAGRSAAAGHKWQAYHQYDAIADKFAGYPAASPAAATRRELAKDPELKKEIAALKQLDRQRALLSSAKPAVRERARAAIRQIIDEQPTSEAARQGDELLKGK